MKRFPPRTFVEGGRKGGLSGRKHVKPRPGDVYGVWTVVSVLGPGRHGRSDLSVLARCVCGVEADVFEFNLRRGRKRCWHVRKPTLKGGPS
jgi:hypothetical protein